MRELRQGLAALRATPTMTAVAVASIALGIGANTAIFSVVDDLMLRSLPVRDPDRLVLVMDAGSGAAQPWNYAVWQEIRRRPELFERSAAWWSGSFTAGSPGDMRQVEGLCVSGGFLDTLGVPMLLGRSISDEDDVRGGGRDGAVAVLGYRYWRDVLGGAADVVSRTIEINDVRYAIAGVTPEYFFGPEPGRRFDVMVALNEEPRVTGLNRVDNRDWSWLTIVGRLRPGQSAEAAQAILRGLRPQIREATLPPIAQPFLGEYLEAGFAVVPAALGDSTLRRRFGRPLWTIMLVVVLVLLITSANLANILVARALARRHEFSIRRALGAGAADLARQLLTESFLLVAFGAAFGLALAARGAPALARLLSTPANPVVFAATFDWRVALFAVSIAVATGLSFGVAPAVLASRADPIDALRESGRVLGGETRRLMAATVVAQVALSVVVVVVAGQFVRSFAWLTSRPLGFDADRVLLATVDAQHARIDALRRVSVYEQVQDALRRLPDVAHASIAAVMPGSANMFRTTVQVSGGVPLADRERLANGNLVSSDWFGVFGPPIVMGRPLDRRDSAASPHVAVVNEAFARRFLNGANPIGRSVTLPPAMVAEDEPAALEIVGVAADAVVRSLRDPIAPTVYLPIEQHDNAFFRRGFASMNVAVQVRGSPPTRAAKAIADAVHGVNANLAVTIRPLAEQMNGSVVQERLVATVSGFFGLLALVLAACGLYGVTSYSVVRRRGELGVRLALGAPAGSVIRLVLTRVAALVGVGLVAGAALSVWASTLLRGVLYGLDARDPRALATAAAAFAIVGLLAGSVPAWKASRIDPAEVLRN